jgi:hypothetical protein
MVNPGRFPFPEFGGCMGAMQIDETISMAHQEALDRWLRFGRSVSKSLAIVFFAAAVMMWAIPFIVISWDDVMRLAYLFIWCTT